MLGIRYLSGPSSSLLDAYGPFPASQPRRVVITGMGLVTPLGLGVQHVWQRLLQGHTAVRQIMPEDLPEVCPAAAATMPYRHCRHHCYRQVPECVNNGCMLPAGAPRGAPDAPVASGRDSAP